MASRSKARSAATKTARRVALLRGVNVGTANRIAMADLRRLFERLGHRDVSTLLNSGNVVFTGKAKDVRDEAAEIEAALLGRHRIKTRVVVLNGKDVIAAVRANPLSSVAGDPARLLVMAFPHAKHLTQLRPLLEARWAPEALAIGASVAYLWCARGIVESRVWAAVNRASEDAGTARNLATMTKLAALVDDAGPEAAQP
jgi:uncharacterized protein (DUF1697 family)